MRFPIIAAALALGLTSCGPKPASESAASAASAAPAERPMSEGEKALRAQAGSYYFDFAKNPEFKRFAPIGLGLPERLATRFSRAMDVASPSVIASSGGVEALVFAGCVAHNCADTTGVLAIGLPSGDVFAGVRDETSTMVIKPNLALQKLLEDTSPTHQWTNPIRGGT